MTTVRYYEPEPNPNAPSPVCYRDGPRPSGPGGAAHHPETPTAPYFVFASFEQADDITNAAGMPVEDADGAIPGSVLQTCPPGQSAPCPTTPATKLNDSYVVNPMTHVPPNVVLAPGAGYCQPGKRLYYVNLRKAALPSKGPICVNYRYNPIPRRSSTPIAPLAAIAAYNGRNNIQSSPWLYYKLLNVQYFPQSNEDPANPFAGGGPDPTGNNPANYVSPVSWSRRTRPADVQRQPGPLAAEPAPIPTTIRSSEGLRARRSTATSIIPPRRGILAASTWAGAWAATGPRAKRRGAISSILGPRHFARSQLVPPLSRQARRRKGDRRWRNTHAQDRLDEQGGRPAGGRRGHAHSQPAMPDHALQLRQDIAGMFTPTDISCMSWHFELASYADVRKRNANAIYDKVASGQMPKPDWANRAGRRRW